MPSRLSLMPVLPSVTWSTAVRLPAGAPAARTLESAHGDSSAVPARRAEEWITDGD